MSIRDPWVGQLDIFVNMERHRENSKSSQVLHDTNIEHFAKQDKRVLDLLRNGAKLTTAGALRIGVGDLRRRIKTLRDAGINVQDEFCIGADGKRNRFKRYFINQNS